MLYGREAYPAVATQSLSIFTVADLLFPVAFIDSDFCWIGVIERSERQAALDDGSHHLFFTTSLCAVKEVLLLRHTVLWVRLV